jgi:hypothetical protein
MGRGLLLWLIGIPLPIILLIWLFGGCIKLRSTEELFSEFQVGFGIRRN